MMLEEQVKTAGRQDSKDSDGKANAIPDSKDKNGGKNKKSGGIFSKLLPK